MPSRVVPTSDDRYLNWWGLLRHPPIYLETPIQRRELVYLGIFLGSCLAAAFGLLLAFVPLTGKIVVLGPAGLIGLPALIGVFLPLALFRDNATGEWILATRMRGGLVGFDRIAFLLIGGAGVLLVIRITTEWVQADELSWILRPWLPSLILSYSGVFFSALLIQILPSLPFIPRGRTVAPPPWLPEEDEKADENPTFSYPFPTPEERLQEVGILVPGDVAAALRSLNREHDGHLYQEDGNRMAVEVVRGLGKTVDGRGTAEIRRLVAQMYAVAAKRDWTPFQLASAILRFVQRNFAYVHDDESTERILGKSYDEYGRFPLETLLDGEGDCEDTAMLCSALLAYAGFPNALIFCKIKESPFAEESGHLAVGLRAEGDLHPPVASGSIDPNAYHVVEGRPYLYAETATDDQHPPGFGVIPDTWRDKIEVVQVVEVDPVG